MNKKMLLRMMLYVGGLFIASLGVSLTIFSDLGASAWDSLYVGLSEKVNTTVGTIIFIVGLIVIFLNTWIGKRKPDLLAMITIFLIGIFVDFWMIRVFSFTLDGSFLIKLLLLVIGVVTIGMGVVIYLRGNIAPNPVDNTMLLLHEKFHLKLAHAKLLLEGFAFVLAIALGGPIGIGTIIITVLIGPIIGLFSKVADRVPIINRVEKTS